MASYASTCDQAPAVGSMWNTAMPLPRPLRFSVVIQPTLANVGLTPVLRPIGKSCSYEVACYYTGRIAGGTRRDACPELCVDNPRQSGDGPASSISWEPNNSMEMLSNRAWGWC